MKNIFAIFILGVFIVILIFIFCVDKSPGKQKSGLYSSSRIESKIPYWDTGFQIKNDSLYIVLDSILYIIKIPKNIKDTSLPFIKIFSYKNPKIIFTDRLEKYKMIFNTKKKKFTSLLVSKIKKPPR